MSVTAVPMLNIEAHELWFKLYHVLEGILKSICHVFDLYTVSQKPDF